MVERSKASLLVAQCVAAVATEVFALRKDIAKIWSSRVSTFDGPQRQHRRRTKF